MKFKLLKFALMSNGIFSSLMGILILVVATKLNSFIGIDYPWWSLGVFLLGFGIFLIYISRTGKLNPVLIKSIIVADILWVLVSVILLLIMELTRTGVWAIVICGLIVADFAIFQWIGLKKIIKN